jgi:hypothetical protein
MMSAPALTHRSQSHEIEAVERHRTQRAVVGRGSSPQRGIGDEPLARSLAGDVGTRVAGMLAAPVGKTGSAPGHPVERWQRTWLGGARCECASTEHGTGHVEVWRVLEEVLEERDCE